MAHKWMKTTRRAGALMVSLLAVMTLLLAACGDAATPASPTATREATAAAPTMAAATPTTLAPAGTAAPVVNDTTQARLRVSQCVRGAPPVDIYLNGVLASGSGPPSSSLHALNVSRYEYLAPGTYSLAVVPTGQDQSQALLGPLNVPVAAGHRYTVVVLGQKDEPSHQALVIDETAAYQAIAAKSSDARHITVNNIRGVAGIDFYEGGLLRDTGVSYGGFKAAVWPAGLFNGLKVTVAGAPGQALDPGFAGEGYNTPASDNVDCFGGTYPGSIGGSFDTHTSPSTSDLPVLDFIGAVNAIAAAQGGKPQTFNTFLSAVQKTGLASLLASGGPYMLFVPSDTAFSELPKDQLDALLSDPQALGALLRSHIVAGYYPPGTLGQGGGVTNLLGASLALTAGDNLVVNGNMIGGGDSVMVANGTRVFFANKLIMPAPPASSTAQPATTATPTSAAIVFTGHTDGLVQASFSPDGKLVATASRDGTARIWDAATGRELLRLTGHSDGVGGAVFSPDGKTLLTTSVDTTARLWDAATGKELRVFTATTALNKGAFSPDGKYIVATAGDGADVWEIATGKSILTFTGHAPANPNRLAFTPDGQAVVTGGSDGLVLLWAPLSGKVLMRFKGHTDVVGTPAISPDGMYLVTGSNDNTARLWDITSGKELYRIETPGAQVQGAAFSPDGQFIATSGSDGLARLWDAQLQQELRRFAGHTGEVRSIVFSPDGKYILTASLDGTARLWPVK